MPRRARVIFPNTPLHIIQRGNNRSVCFYTEDDFLLDLDWLACAAHDIGSGSAQKSALAVSI